MKKRTKFGVLVALVLVALVASVSLAQAADESCDAGMAFCFAHKVRKPLDTLETLERPNIAVPNWYTAAPVTSGLDANGNVVGGSN